jgi:hypothetical protein
MNYNLVFIDDNMREGLDNPFIRSIGKFKEDATLSVFIDPQEGLDFVLNNLNSRMIVFLDCKFDGYGLQGINVLKKIREQTSLLYIVMMSANAISQIAGLDIIEMINEDFIWFFDRNNGTVKDACDLIDRIKTLWATRFDCVLEQWLIRHPEDNDKEAFSEASTGRTYTWADILEELRLQTSVGKSFEQKLNEYYIYQLNRSNK